MKSKIQIKQLPFYVDCDKKEIKYCDWYMHRNCPETCGYAQEVRGLGVGAIDVESVKKIREIKVGLERVAKEYPDYIMLVFEDQFIGNRLDIENDA